MCKCRVVVNVIVYYACVDLCVVYADNETETVCVEW